MQIAESPSQSAQSKRSDVATATYSASDTFSLIGCAYSTGMELVKSGSFPVEPIRVGRQLRFPKAHVDRLLGLDDATKTA